MTHRETIINIVKVAQRMTNLLGHSNNFATLSQVLTYNNLYIIMRNLSRVLIYGFPCKPTREAALFVINLTQKNDNKNK